MDETNQLKESALESSTQMNANILQLKSTETETRGVATKRLLDCAAYMLPIKKPRTEETHGVVNEVPKPEDMSKTHTAQPSGDFAWYTNSNNSNTNTRTNTSDTRNGDASQNVFTMILDRTEDEELAKRLRLHTERTLEMLRRRSAPSETNASKENSVQKSTNAQVNPNQQALSQPQSQAEQTSAFPQLPQTIGNEVVLPYHRTSREPTPETSVVGEATASCDSLGLEDNRTHSEQTVTSPTPKTQAQKPARTRKTPVKSRAKKIDERAVQTVRVPVAKPSGSMGCPPTDYASLVKPFNPSKQLGRIHYAVPLCLVSKIKNPDVENFFWNDPKYSALEKYNMHVNGILPIPVEKENHTDIGNAESGITTAQRVMLHATQ